MIRIESNEADLYNSISNLSSTWMNRASVRTNKYKKLGKYGGGSEFWGEIKGAYIDLQFEKCAYCEMKLAGKDLASKVHEVEHFRPKSRVRKWPGKPRKDVAPFVPPCKVGRENAGGYYLLSYHPLNYAIACTRCNSTLKSDYFPIRGRRHMKASDPADIQLEDALLIYPLFGIDADPATLIRFDGVLAVPVKKSGKNFERAIVTIEFFQLNHEDLTTRRAQVIAILWDALRTLDVPALPANLRKSHASMIDLSTKGSSEYSSCARDFVQLYRKDVKLAAKYGQLAQKLVGR